MPETTAHALTYPDGTGHTRLWEHIQALAEDVDRELGEVQRPPMCKVVADAQAITGSLTTVTMGTTAYDTDAMADLGADGIRIKTPGWYVLSALNQFSSNATGYRATVIRVSGVYVAHDYRGAVNGTITAATIQSEPLLLAANDLVTLLCLQNSGVNLNNGPANGLLPWLSARMVRPA